MTSYPEAEAAIARAIRYLDDTVEDQPELEDVARVAGLNPFATQRLFSALVGVSPKKFLQCLTLERAKEALASGQSVLDAAYEAGLSGPGRLHDLFLTLDAVSPGEFKAAGDGMELRHGLAPSPFGDCLFLWGDRGLMGLGFLAGFPSYEAALADHSVAYTSARLVRDDAGASELAAKVFTLSKPSESRGSPLRLFVAGTGFQAQVWRALLRIPAGTLVSYEQLAKAIGKPGAARAVGNAVGANPVAFLVPCHRVVRQTGVIGNYRWGGETKRLILGAEAALTGRD
ncbi:methylated-DNA--[protein]-cysteine S-methyltransferase [Lacibacterium aquatile]|uniref:Methylated-DNA--[protein]-cysteine S-methyltransferase n=1 Tax=Lacibacterium aquatile TaxID=1168082 RepID=A0ABW5DLP9_9PROT